MRGIASIDLVGGMEREDEAWSESEKSLYANHMLTLRALEKRNQKG